MNTEVKKALDNAARLTETGAIAMAATAICLQLDEVINSIDVLRVAVIEVAEMDNQ